MGKASNLCMYQTVPSTPHSWLMHHKALLRGPSEGGGVFKLCYRDVGSWPGQGRVLSSTASWKGNVIWSWAFRVWWLLWVGFWLFVYAFGFCLFELVCFKLLLAAEDDGQTAMLGQGRYEFCQQKKSCLNSSCLLDGFCIGINWRNVLEMLTKVITVFYGATITALECSASACWPAAICNSEEHLEQGLSLRCPLCWQHLRQEKPCCWNYYNNWWIHMYCVIY